jgi:isopentenyl-diphosphate delta-isomerase
MHRTQDEFQARLAGAFINWGIPTAEAIKIVRKTSPALPVIASGGLRSGVDIAKCLALGATIGGMAGPFLKAASHSLEKTIELIELTRKEIQICMFATGAANLEAFTENRIQRTGSKNNGTR